MTVKERLFHAVLFEAGAIILSVLFIWLTTGKSGMVESASMILISFIAMVWNMIFNWIFDKFFTFPKQYRTAKLRLFHTVAFETGLLIFTIPVIAYFLAVDWFIAFLMDVGISITIMLYGYFFNWGYDHMRATLINKR